MLIGSFLILAGGGLISGILAGMLGIGGGFIIVSLLITLGFTPIQAIATSSLVIVMTSVSGSLYNWKIGCLDPRRVIYLALPALVTTNLGVYFASRISPALLLLGFGTFLLLNILLLELRKRLVLVEGDSSALKFNPMVSRLATGGAAGVLAGFFGGAGGNIMVPLQMLLLGEPIKVAIRTSLGVIVCTAVSASIVHASEGNILFLQGLTLGSGSLLGAQISTRFLPKLRDSVVYLTLRSFLMVMSIYMFWRAWRMYQDISAFS